MKMRNADQRGLTCSPSASKGSDAGSLLLVLRQIPEPSGDQWGHEEQHGHAGGKNGDLTPPGQAGQGRNRPKLGPRGSLIPGLGRGCDNRVAFALTGGRPRVQVIRNRGRGFWWWETADSTIRRGGGRGLSDWPRRFGRRGVGDGAGRRGRGRDARCGGGGGVGRAWSRARRPLW